MNSEKPFCQQVGEQILLKMKDNYNAEETEERGFDYGINKVDTMKY